jgi:putative salt-induced outer membrane protein
MYRIICCLLLLLATSINAATTTDKKQEPLDIFSGEASLGLVINTGNTDSENLNAELSTTYRPIPEWENKVKFSAQLISKEGTRTQEKYNFKPETRYFIKKHTYLYGNAGLLFDRFSPFTYQIKESIGIGQRLIDSEVFIINIQIGPGGTHREERSTGIKRDELVANISGDLSYQLSEGTRFSQDIDVTIDEQNTFIESETALNMKIIGNLGMKISYKIEYNSFVPVDSKNDKRMDTTTNIAIVYSFT